jgi:hypothetical protein
MRSCWWRLVALAVLGLLVLGACSSGGNDEAGGDTSDAAPATGDGTAPGGSSSGPASGDDCVIGTWELGEQAVQAQYDALGAQSGVAFQASGRVVLDFRTDGTFTYVPDDLSLTLEQAGTVTEVDLGGTSSGTYTADGESLQMQVTDDGLENAIAINGQPVDPSVLLGEGTTLTQTPFDSASFRCEDGDLVIVTASTTAVGTELVLTPA